MKTKSLIFLVILLLLGSNIRAESYQRWIYWVNAPKHILTKQEMSDILNMLGHKNIVPNKVYELSSGVTLRIPQPDLFLEKLMFSIKKSDPSVNSVNDACKSILAGQVVMWGNDISARVRNYYYSPDTRRVEFMNNYSGADIIGGVPVLLINGNPTIKFDCGNPLEVINFIAKSQPIEPFQPNITEFWDREKVTNPEINLVKRTKFIPASIILLPKQNANPSYVTKTETTRVKTWWGKNWPYVVAGVVVVGGITYLILDKDGKIDPRKMPDDGVPPETRKMPDDGIGLRFQKVNFSNPYQVQGQGLVVRFGGH